MFDVNVAYFPIGRKTFDMETAERYFHESLGLLKSNCEHLMAPEQILTSVDELSEFIQQQRSFQPEFIVFQMITFADAEFIAKVMEHYPSQPVHIWSVREPAVGGRLRLNSLTGGNSTCNALKYFERDFDFMLGNATEPGIIRSLHAKFSAIEMIKKLKKLSVGVVGEHPAGFFFSGVDELELMKTTGVKVHNLDLHQMFKKAMEIREEEYLPMIEAAASKVVGLKKDEETTIKFAKFSTYLKKYITQHGIKATAIRCWPDFFVELGAAACSTLSQFTEDGIVSSCEADINGVITMYIQQELSGGLPPYLGDLVHLDEERNSVSFWHCGAGAYSLANPRTGAKAGVHPNRKLGFSLEFGLKPGQVTISRLSKTSSGYRMLIMRGEALDSPQQFNGTSGEVRLNGNAKEIVHSLMMGGFEPHYSIVYADIADELLELSKRLGIEAVTYT
jgi:L-fucose isomerase-like protein